MAKPLGLPMERTFSSQADFEAFAGAFAAGLRPGDVVGLAGALGAGKTTFVRACVRALQGTDPTSSPTFTFWHHYPGPPPIDHLDLYRVDGPADLTELGLGQAFDGTSIVLVEWWTNASSLLPSRRYELEISGAGDQARRVTVRPPA